MLRTCHTAGLSDAERRAIRSLLDAAFAGLFDDADWEHCLGGTHALVEVGGALVAHGSLVQRRMLYAGRSLRTGYVEAVAVAPAHQRQGHASAIMTALEALRGGYHLLALSASERGAVLYRSRGWQPWRGATATLTPSGVEPTPDDDGSVFVLPGDWPAGLPLDLDAGLTCDWREGDVW